MKTSQILTEAKALIINPENWMQKDYTDGEGCFCSLGAIASVMGYDLNVAGTSFDVERKADILKEVVKEHNHFKRFPNQNFAGYNDAVTHTEVMDAFDKAIALAISRGD